MPNESVTSRSPVAAASSPVPGMVNTKVPPKSMLFNPGSAFDSITAARSVHAPVASPQAPSPGEASTASYVALTVKETIGCAKALRPAKNTASTRITSVARVKGDALGDMISSPGLAMSRISQSWPNWNEECREDLEFRRPDGLRALALREAREPLCHCRVPRRVAVHVRLVRQPFGQGQRERFERRSPVVPDRTLRVRRHDARDLQRPPERFPCQDDLLHEPNAERVRSVE